MDELRFSMYDIILKSINQWYGHAMGKLWKTIDAERQEDIKVHSGFHFAPPENFEDDWYIDVEGNAFANYKATSAMVHVREFGDDGLIYGEPVFVNRYWVYSLLQFCLGYDYRGFSSKQEAYGYYKQQQEDPDYFDVVLYRIRASDRCDFIPMEFRYPVMEIMEKNIITVWGMDSSVLVKDFRTSSYSICTTSFTTTMYDVVKMKNRNGGVCSRTLKK